MSLALPAAPIQKSVTREEFAALPEGPPFYELIDGELVMSPSPVGPHVEFFLYLIEKLRPHVRSTLRGKLLGEFDLYLPDTEDVYRPDLLYISAERLSTYRRRGVYGVPDLVGEILSPGTWRHDREVKQKAFERAGVSHLWLVQPEPLLTIEEYFLTSEGQYRQHAVTSAPARWSPLLFPGWSLDLAEAQAEMAMPPESEETEDEAAPR